MRPPEKFAPDSPPADSALRGLDPAALLGVLDGAPRSRPVIAGWEVEGIIGEGGLGLVWRGRRIADGVVAAVKVPRLVDVDHIERLEQEAGMLRSLAHPQIVRLLESGPTDDGGMYLAMEFIDGPTLAHVLPAGGFAPKHAFELFDQIAEAVVHAHARGVLHRDLKPGNILLDAEGRAHIADFGLARPVHERVQHLSLTQTGLIAGTFEYLPPEAYHANYTPDARGDVYALGVILHELLTGSPPRGAWRAVSEQKRVDIRVDEALRRALDPDPAVRWPSVDVMRNALAEIHCTPPRYSGTPLVTRSVRATDFAWTVLGMLALIAAIGVDMKMGLIRVPWPIDLVGPHTRLTGGAQALWWLSLALAPVALWQIIRLVRFRAVPLREALPSPFGIRLGASRTAAGLVLVAQLFCLIIPALLLVDIFSESATKWLKPGAPAWRSGLIVTKWESDKLVDPWSWPEKDAHYWLKEYRGLPGNLLARQLDRIDFYPGVMPWTLTAAAAIIALALVGTGAIAVVRWWPHHRARAMTLLTASLALVGWASWPQPKALPLTEQQQHDREQVERRDEKALYAGLSEQIVRTLYSNEPPDREAIERKVMIHYGSEVVFRGRGKIPMVQVATLLVEEADAARENGRTVSIVASEWMPGGWQYMESVHFHTRTVLLVFTEPRGEVEATGAWITIEHFATTAPDRGTMYISEEKYSRDELYHSAARDLPAADAGQWARDFVDALGIIAASGTTDPLERLLTKRCYIANDAWRSRPSEQRSLKREEFIALLRASLLSDKSRTRPTLAGPPQPAERQPGARQRITFPVLDANGVTHWQADLVFAEGGWRAVTVRF